MSEETAIGGEERQRSSSCSYMNDIVAHEVCPFCGAEKLKGCKYCCPACGERGDCN